MIQKSGTGIIVSSISGKVLHTYTEEDAFLLLSYDLCLLLDEN